MPVNVARDNKETGNIGAKRGTSNNMGNPRMFRFTALLTTCYCSGPHNRGLPPAIPIAIGMPEPPVPPPLTPPPPVTGP